MSCQIASKLACEMRCLTSLAMRDLVECKRAQQITQVCLCIERVMQARP
jgi:hypothetical protein